MKQESGAGHLLMLETIREYGLERLVASGELEVARHAHAAYYLALAEQAEPSLLNMRQSSWLERLEQEHENLPAALEWLLECKAVEEALRLSGALRQFWFMRASLNKGRCLLERAIAAMREDNISMSPQVRAKALFTAGWLVYWQSDFERARLLVGESLEFFRQEGDTRGEANALRLLGTFENGVGEDYTAGDAFFAESLRLFREAGDGEGIPTILVTQGALALFQGELARAQELCRQSLALFREAGDSWYIALAMRFLGWTSYCQGAYAAARRLSEESVALFRKLGNPGYTAEALTILAYEVTALGEETAAASLLEEALSLAKHAKLFHEEYVLSL